MPVKYNASLSGFIARDMAQTNTAIYYYILLLKELPKGTSNYQANI